MTERVSGDTFLAGAGELRTAIREFDWARTPIGPIASWSNSLRNIVNLVVNTRHPMFLWWGSDLVQFYNDAYRPSLGHPGHPAALGALGRDFWSAIWPTIGPQIDAVMQRGESTWNEDHLVPIFRNGRLEEVYWTYGYSPVWDDDGCVGGTLVVVQEQTARVLTARRVRTARDLAASASVHQTQAQAWAAGFGALMSNPHDVPWALGYAVGAEGPTARLVAHTHPDVTGTRNPGLEFALEASGVLREVVEGGEPVFLSDLRAFARDVVVPPWPEVVGTAWLLPIRRPRSRVPCGILAVGLSPRLPFDEAYQDFLLMAADQLASAIGNANSREDEQHLLEELAQLSDRLRGLFEQAPAGVAVMSGPEHRYEVANPVYRAITHRANLIGRTFGEAFPEVVGTDLPAVLDRVYETGVPFVADEYCVALDRSGAGSLEESFFSFHLAPVRDTAGSITGVIVVAVDVTEQVRTRRELQRAQARLDFTLDAAGVGYWDLDLVTHAASCSLRHHQIFGYPSTLIAWTFEAFLAHVVPEERDRVTAAFQRALATGQDLDVECQILTTPGARRWIHAYGRVERMDGIPVRLLGIVNDVTERRDSLAREQEARKTAEHASHAKDVFLATLSHELRTPMNTIIGWTELLSQGGLEPEDAQEGLATIHRHAQAQARMIEDLLDMGRIVSGKVHVEPRLLRLAEVLGLAIGAVAHAAKAKGVAVITGRLIDDGLVGGDAALLQQVFWNLLGNAVKFTPSGGTVTVTLDRAGPQLEVTIRDTGEGIAPDFLPSVFDRFRQADGTSTRTHGGLGIGLSIVKQLVEAHGGTVHGASGGRGQGAVFTVSLPEAGLRRGQDAAPGGLRAAMPETLLSPELQLRGARILVVDDDRDTRHLIKRILTGCHANVVTAGSAAEALGALCHHTFDLLVSDIGMPHEDGYEFIHRVRTLNPSRGGAVPALALTAYGRPEDRQRALDAGFQVHVSKPIEQARLLQACASLLRVRRAE